MAELTCPSAPTVGSCRQEIVLVDEDLDHHQPLLTYVQTCGWPISPFQSWAEASQHLQRCPPRLLIVGDGVACQPTLDQRLQFLRQHPATQPIKVVVIRDPDRPASYPPGVDAWLDLPLTIPKLERILTL